MNTLHFKCKTKECKYWTETMCKYPIPIIIIDHEKCSNFVPGDKL